MSSLRHIRRSLVISVSLLISVSFIAEAQTASMESACETSDKILQTLSLIRNIQTDTRGRQYGVYLARLGALTPQIQLSNLTQNNAVNTDRGSAQGPDLYAVSQYLDTLRTASAIAATSSSGDARQILIRAITPEVTNSLQSVENYWNCRTRDIVAQTTRSNSLADFSGQSAVATDYTQSEASKTASQQSKARGLSANSRVLKQSKVGRDVSFDISPPYLLILGFLILGLTIYTLQRRSKGFKARQKRRILNMPVRVRSNNRDIAMLLVDISRNGVKIQHGSLLDGAKKVTLHINDEWHAGHIIWSNDSFAGVQFKKPMKAQTFNSVVQDSLMAKGVTA